MSGTSLGLRVIVTDNIEIELERWKTEIKGVVTSIISVYCAYINDTRSM